MAWRPVQGDAGEAKAVLEQVPRENPPFFAPPVTESAQMRKGTKVIVSLLTLIGSCLVCAWLWPYASYFLLVSMIGQGSQNRMHCWVKVVDQDGKGVPDYQCRVVQEHASWWPFSRNGDIVKLFKTGPDGVFEYKSKGSAGRVLFGYDGREQWRLNPEHLVQSNYLTVTSFEFRQAVQRDESHYLGSQDNPFVLHVFTVGPPQKLLFWKNRLKLEVPNDYACVDLLSGRVWESKVPEGDIAMCDNPITEDNIKRYCGISFAAGKNCGMCPVVDDWGLGPPESGYRNELCADRDWRALRIRAGGDYAVYYRIQDHVRGRILYGRLLVGGSGRVADGVLECFANLQGERNLYYKGYTDFDKHQAIQDFVPPPVQ